MGLTRQRPGIRLLTVTLTGLLLAAAEPVILPWGFDVDGMDRSVKPGDDFDRYSNGAWKQATPIPPDRSAWGPFAMLRAKAESDVKAIVDDIAGRPQPASSIERKTISIRKRSRRRHWRRLPRTSQRSRRRVRTRMSRG